MNDASEHENDVTHHSAAYASVSQSEGPQPALRQGFHYMLMEL